MIGVVLSIVIFCYQKDVVMKVGEMLNGVIMVLFVIFGVLLVVMLVVVCWWDIGSCFGGVFVR